MTVLVRAAGLLALAAVLSGCADVRPWERGALADRRLRWLMTPERAAAREHVFTVREGAEGGHGNDGSGCGCN